MLIFVLSVLMWVVVLLPLWLYLGIQASIGTASRLGVLRGRLARIDEVLNGA